MLGLDLGEPIDAERVGVDLRLRRHRRAAGGDGQVDEIFRIVLGERPGLAAVGAGAAARAASRWPRQSAPPCRYS